MNGAITPSLSRRGAPMALVAALTLAAGLTACDTRSLAERAQAGDAEAQYRYANEQFGGEPKPAQPGGAYTGVPAFNWMLRSAQQGYAPAFCEAGAGYQYGKGPPAGDFAQAMAWYRRGAAAHEWSCERSLGVMISAGQGAPKDPVQGYAWLLIAKSDIDHLPLGSQETRGNVSAYGRNGVDSLAADMSADQIAAGKQLAASWRPDLAARPATPQ